MLTTTLLLMLAAMGDAPHSMRLVADVPPPPAELATDYATWTKQQLRDEYDRLAATRPGIALPIGLMVTGGGVFVTAFYVFLIAGGLSGGPGALPLFILLGVAGVASAALIIIGGIVLSRILPDRRVIGRQLDTLERLANERDEHDQRTRPRSRRIAPEEAPVPVPEEPEYIGPPPVGPPPLPLPPMPQTAAPSIPIFLARF